MVSHERAHQFNSWRSILFTLFLVVNIFFSGREVLFYFMWWDMAGNFPCMYILIYFCGTLVLCCIICELEVLKFYTENSGSPSLGGSFVWAECWMDLACHWRWTISFCRMCWLWKEPLYCKNLTFHFLLTFFREFFQDLLLHEVKFLSLGPSILVIHVPDTF